jgi:hypothetical protein
MAGMAGASERAVEHDLDMPQFREDQFAIRGKSETIAITVSR